MSFNLTELKATLAARGPVVRVVVAKVHGSAPREAGASMLVWDGGQSGTIGGGALELDATKSALRLLTSDQSRQTRRIALGPEMGQCCGGAVILMWERFEAATLPSKFPFSRAVMGAETPPAWLNDPTDLPAYSDGWFCEAETKATRSLWIYGAGHVGRAIVQTLAPLPDFSITWVDTAADRFPEDVPSGVTIVPATRPEILVPHAPKNAEHLILTYSHDMDLALCHAALTRGFARCGLIGSETKWARFRSRLAALGHSQTDIAQIACPIGDPSLGKHPQALAIGVAAEVLKSTNGHAVRGEKTG